MTTQYWILLLVLLIAAATVRGSFAFTILYFLLGAYFLGVLWLRYSARRIRVRRLLQPYAFWGEDVVVRLQFKNQGVLPVPWLHIHESVPVNLATSKEIKRVLALGPREEHTLEYKLRARKRGYYLVGPLFTLTGDLVGLAGTMPIEVSSDALIVYPLMVPIQHIQIPSFSPQGTLRHKQPIFEDPTRVLGKRDYLPGDSLRRIDWKTTAASGRLQVKQFEPSIALEVVIFLNLNNAEYPSQYRIDSMELAITIAASIANWVSSQRQSVGLVTNGLDSVNEGKPLLPVPPRKGRGHLIRVLEMLARVQAADTTSIVSLLNEHGPHLSWGTTIVLITGQADESLFDEMFQARRRGQNIVLIISGRTVNIQEAEHRAKHFRIPFYAVRDEDDLMAWR